LWPNFRYYLGICLEGLRKTTKNLSQVSRSPGRDLNPGPPEYEAGVLTTRPRRSVPRVGGKAPSTQWIERVPDGVARKNILPCQKSSYVIPNYDSV
jgi:hypothetical protein